MTKYHRTEPARLPAEVKSLPELRLQLVKVPRTKADKGAVRKIAFSPDGKWLFWQEGSFRIHLWDCQNGKEVSGFPPWCPGVGIGAEQAIANCAFSPDGKTLALALPHGTLLWNWGNPNSKVASLPQTEKGEPIHGVLAFSPDWKMAATRAKKTVNLWRRGENQPFDSIACQTSSLSLSPDGKVLAIGGPPGGPPRKVQLWSLQQNSVQQRPDLETTEPIVRFAPTQDKKLLATAGKESVSLWDLTATPFLWKRFEFTQGPERVILAFAPAGHCLAAVKKDQLFVWDLARGTKCNRTLPCQVNDIAFGDNHHLATAGSDGTIHIFQLPARSDQP